MQKNIMKARQEILESYKPNEEIIILDTETTGFRSSDKVIQFSAIKYRIKDDYSLEEIEEMDAYINPEIALPDEIVEFNEKNGTGITDDFLKNYPTEDVVYPQILQFLGNTPITGYNVGFDFRMINGVANRLGMVFDKAVAFDILNMARDFYEKPKDVPDHKLSTMANLLAPQISGFHSAINDVRATGYVLQALVKKYINFVPPNAKNVKLLKARLSYNILTKNRRKLLLKLNIGKEGNVYYDCDNEQWVVDDAIQEQVYIPEIEMQFKNMYLIPFGYDTIDELAQEWFEQQEKLGAKKTTRKKATKKS